jgi:sugar/nucleoside kinase (ribokinase family)
VHDDPAVGQIANALRRYVQGKPRAADSPRGIREWWLANLEPAPTPEQVEAALRILQDEGTFIVVMLDDGSELWRSAAG